MNVAESVAVVSGGASGLGAACARRLVQLGGRVAILDLDEQGGSALSSELGDNAIFCPADVADETAVMAALAMTRKSFAGVNVCLNCAGVANRFEPIIQDGVPMPLDDFERVIRINLTGTFNLARLAAAEMARNEPNPEGERGLIVLLSSVAGIEGGRCQVPYAASKLGVAGMVLPMMRDLADYGIRVMALAPGAFDTPMTQGFLKSAEMREAATRDLVFPRRMGRPEELAGLVVAMIETVYLNGELIRIDAGYRSGAR